MFDKSKNDMTVTLNRMVNAAMDSCQSNQTVAAQRMAQWIRQDRRFDGVDAEYLAGEAFSARRSGRSINFEKPYRPQGGGIST